MTVAELIVLLQQAPDQGARVIVEGYEGGYNDVGSAPLRAIRLNVHTVAWYGPHDDADADGAGADEIAVFISK
jgi:hypothetical protein